MAAAEPQEPVLELAFGPVSAEPIPGVEPEYLRLANRPPQVRP